MSQESKVALDKNRIPACFQWSIEDVEWWVENELKFPQYKLCFSKNYISGRKLIHMEASNLPKIGITDFDHIKHITGKIRELLGISYPHWNRPITLPPRNTKEHFIERKSITGTKSDELTYEQHVKYLKDFVKHGVHDVDWKYENN